MIENEDFQKVLSNKFSKIAVNLGLASCFDNPAGSFVSYSRILSHLPGRFRLPDSKKSYTQASNCTLLSPEKTKMIFFGFSIVKKKKIFDNFVKK